MVKKKQRALDDEPTSHQVSPTIIGAKAVSTDPVRDWEGVDTPCYVPSS